MKERPILFSAPMIRAILAGTKTQTRRLIKPVGNDKGFVLQDYGDGFWPYRSEDGESGFYRDRDGYDMEERIKCPYGKPGDRLWVRETWYCDDYRVQSGPYLMPDDMNLDEARDDGTLIYAASTERSPYEGVEPVWKPSIHMPRWASRITLEVAGVKVERLQEISETDAQAEGIVSAGDGNGFQLADTTHYMGTAREAYASLWESINGDGSWDANPWVWCVSFSRLAAA